MAKEDGTTEADSLRRALSAMENRSGDLFESKKKEIQELLDMPDLPEEFLSAWMAWAELNVSRSNNGYGPNPLSFSEIKAFVELTGTLLLPYEIKGIRVIDTAFMKAYNDVSRATKAANKTKQDPQTPQKAPSRRR